MFEIVLLYAFGINLKSNCVECDSCVNIYNIFNLNYYNYNYCGVNSL